MKQDQIVIYQTEDGQTQIDVRLENETVWLNVSQMASLFNKEDSNIRRHVLNAFKEGELERDNNNVHFLHVNGVKKPVPYYSLDVIISESMLTPELLAQLREYNAQAQSQGKTLAESALAWILSQKGVTSVLVGASSTSQLEKNLRCVITK